MAQERAKLPSDVPLAIETDPRPADIQFLEDGLIAFNTAAAGFTDGEGLSVFLRAADGSALGGAFGWSWGKCCYLRYVYLAPELRQQGRGTQLMQAVEAEARRRGCRQIVLETHSFQAPGFYRKLGFEAVGDVADYPLGHRYLTLVKRLA
jgi:GNAT superfamily N-acetyltransferase